MCEFYVSATNAQPTRLFDKAAAIRHGEHLRELARFGESERPNWSPVQFPVCVDDQDGNTIREFWY